MDPVTTRTITPGLYILTAVCGVVDAASFLALGNVFSEIMTGNLMFLAFRIGQGDLGSALPLYLVPLVSFSLGAVGCGYLLKSRRVRGRRRLGFVVICVLVAVAAVLAWTWSLPGDSTQAMVVVAILAFSMGMQNAMVLYHVVPDVATNVMTLTMVRLLSNLSIIGGDNARWNYRVLSLATFFVAAGVGAFLVQFGAWAPLALGVLLYLLALPMLLTWRSPADSDAVA